MTTNYIFIVIFRRYVANGTFFEELVAASRQLKETRSAVGGNAPVMANRFQIEGSKVLLASTVSNELLSQINPEIQGLLSLDN